MLDKQRVLAITKSDLLDEDLIEMLRETLPTDLPVVFISSVTGYGLAELKDVLWNKLNSESNKLQDVVGEDTIVHRDKDWALFQAEMRAEGADEVIEVPEEDIIDVDEDDLEDIDELDDYEYVDPNELP